MYLLLLSKPLDKKVPRNKKYENVKPTFSTGPTVRDIEVVSNSTIAKKRNELFKRIKTSTVSHLIAVNPSILCSSKRPFRKAYITSTPKTTTSSSSSLTIRASTVRRLDSPRSRRSAPSPMRLSSSASQTKLPSSCWTSENRRTSSCFASAKPSTTLPPG